MHVFGPQTAELDTIEMASPWPHGRWDEFLILVPPNLLGNSEDLKKKTQSISKHLVGCLESTARPLGQFCRLEQFMFVVK